MATVKVLGESDHGCEVLLDDPVYIFNEMKRSIQSDIQHELPNKELPLQIKSVQPTQRVKTNFTSNGLPTGWMDDVTFSQCLDYYESLQDEFPIQEGQEGLKEGDLEKLIEIEKWFVKVIPSLNWAIQNDGEGVNSAHKWYGDELNRQIICISPFCREDLTEYLKGKIILDSAWKIAHANRISLNFNAMFFPVRLNVIISDNKPVPIRMTQKRNPAPIPTIPILSKCVPVSLKK